MKFVKFMDSNPLDPISDFWETKLDFPDFKLELTTKLLTYV